MASLLLTAGVAAAAIPPGVEARAARWRDTVAGKKILLLLDDAAGHEQVRPLLPGTAGSLVLITSRRRLAALEEQLRHHPVWTAAGLAAELSSAKERLELIQAENVSVVAAFGVSYQDLTSGTQRLFRRLGLVPGPDFDAHAAAAVDGTSLDQARRHLGELYDQHLLTEPTPGRYRLHDLLREHARALAAADDPAESGAAVSRLLDYYLHTALGAGRHIPSSNRNLDSLPTTRPPACAPALTAPGQAAAWLEAERANLHAATDHAAANELPVHAMLIPAATASFLSLRGHWDQAIALHQTALAAARQVGDRPGQARALMLLSEMQVWTGDSTAAEQALALFRDLGDRAGQGDALNDLGMLHRLTGRYPAAATCFQQALDLFRDLGNQHGQSDALASLSHLYCLTGNYPAARACTEQALELSRDFGNRRGQAVALNYLGMVQRLTGDHEAATASAPAERTRHLPAHRCPRHPASPGSPPQREVARSAERREIAHQRPTQIG